MERGKTSMELQCVCVLRPSRGQHGTNRLNVGLALACCLLGHLHVASLHSL